MIEAGHYVRFKRARSRKPSVGCWQNCTVSGCGRRVADVRGRCRALSERVEFSVVKRHGFDSVSF
jgi:hypothetical protein